MPPAGAASTAFPEMVLEVMVSVELPSGHSATQLLMPPPPATPVQTPTARPRSSGGKAAVMVDRVAGITNAAALALDTRSMALTAMVGSAGFFNNAIQGQVNGTTAWPPGVIAPRPHCQVAHAIPVIVVIPQVGQG